MEQTLKPHTNLYINLSMQSHAKFIVKCLKTMKVQLKLLKCQRWDLGPNISTSSTITSERKSAREQSAFTMSRRRIKWQTCLPNLWIRNSLRHTGKRWWDGNLSTFANHDGMRECEYIYHQGPIVDMLWRAHARTSPFIRIWSIHDQDYACVLASWNISEPARTWPCSTKI